MAVPIPSYYLDAESRCNEACLATQERPFSDPPFSGNGAIAMLLHLVADPDCTHCANYPSKQNVESAWYLLDVIVKTAKK